MSTPRRPPEPLIIVGMHRSGTSLLASLLHSAGLHVGDKLSPPAPGNLEGQFEDLEFVDLHSAALRAGGLDPEGWDEVVLDTMPAAYEALAQGLVSAREELPLWGWKDPRTTLFLPFWERFLPQARFVFVYRAPWEVIDSLYRRGDARFQKEPQLTARAWAHHNRIILDGLERLRGRAALFSLEQVVSAPAAVVERLNRVLGVGLRPPLPGVYKAGLLRTGGDLRTAEALFRAHFEPESALLGALDRSSERLTGEKRSPDPETALPDLRGAVLSQWSSLRRAEHARRAPAIGVRVFVPAEGAYSEPRSAMRLLPGDGETRILSFEFDYDGSAALRLDPGESAAIVELSSVEVRERSGRSRLTWAGPALASAPVALGNLVPLASLEAGLLRLLCVTEDPQIYLDLPDPRRFAGKCDLEVAIAVLPINTKAAVGFHQQLTRLECLSEARVHELSARHLVAARAADDALGYARRQCNQLERQLASARSEAEAGRHEVRRAKEAVAEPGPLVRRRAQVWRMLLGARRARRLASALSRSGLFDADFYLATNPDVAARGLEPLAHYLRHGARELRSPHPLFDARYYLESNPDVAAAGEDPLVHFVRQGAREGRRPHALFDSEFYRGQTQDAAAAALDPSRFFSIAMKADFVAMAEAIARQRAAGREAGPFEAPPLVAVSADDLASAASTLSFEGVERPLVTIVVPAFNQAKRTLECLLSLRENTTGVPYEVVLVDDASVDDTRRLFESVPNLVYRRSEENLGRLEACARAAELARGEFLVLLHGDVQVTSGWLTPLVETLGSDRVGAVGPKVLLPDGRLKEAGARVLADGTPELAGESEDPSQPRYGRAREVDCCSGVCLALRTSRFRDLGGFGAGPSPAGRGGVDLCLRLRASGLRVVYQPASVVVHRVSEAAPGDEVETRGAVGSHERVAETHRSLIDDLHRVRLIAFYLPQYHPIPENDRWWGRGFTEWRNVARAVPNFEGHYQPRIPADLGFYDLRLPETMRAQTDLARRHGVHGFCFYYYWFAGKRLLEAPLEMRLEDRANDFPFCLAWANENWTRTWDGLDTEVLISQHHSEADDRAVIRDLMRYFEHPAYIRIEGRPLLLVYRASLLPDARRTADIWRDTARRAGAPEPYLALMETFEEAITRPDPGLRGFDAAVEFPPHEMGHEIPLPGRRLNPRFEGAVYDYRKTVLGCLGRPHPGHRCFRTVLTGWDNTARRQDNAAVFVHASPGNYRAWLEAVIVETLHQNAGEERIAFINAWNEWAEGAYLEPDLRYGHAFLEATRDAQATVLHR